MRLIHLDGWNMIIVAQEVNFDTCQTHKLLKIRSQNTSFPNKSFPFQDILEIISVQNIT